MSVAADGANLVAEVSDDDNEIFSEPDTLRNQYLRPRRNGICAETWTQGYYKKPFWNKHEKWDIKLRDVLRGRGIVAHVSDSDVSDLIRSMSTHIYYSGDCIAHQGEDGDYLFCVLEGQVDSYFDAIGAQRGGTRQHQNERELKEQELKDRQYKQGYKSGDIVDEIACVWRLPRPLSYYARGEQVIIAKLSRQDYVNLVVRSKTQNWWSRQDRLVKVPLLEMMEPEQIAQLVDVMTIRKYEANMDIVVRGDYGDEFFILDSGSARVWVREDNGDEKEFVRLYGGDLFGELALLNHTKRAATVTTLTRSECLVLGRKQFERVLGPMQMLQNTQYLTDPRKLIAEFYKPGDSRGSYGSLKLHGKEPDLAHGRSNWFAVYRPTSRDAIAKMQSGNAVGKGLNVKGKSSKQGVLSGYVPFSQISDNKHRPLIEKSPKGARTRLYYRSKPNRDEAVQKLTTEMNKMDARSMDIRKIDILDDYAPKMFGIELPEPVLHEVYLMQPDLSPVMGWETGRRSEPAFMDMNLHAIRDASTPRVVLYQFDKSDPMNPRGLLIAYAEEQVKPVVSDFDTFTVASKGMSYEAVPEDQVKIVVWMLEHAENVLSTPDHNPWTVRWLDVLKKEGEKGFHPKFPPYGFGDPTSYRLIADIVNETKDCGAIRHGAECFNYYFPQELDDEFMIVWDGFPDKPFAYKTEQTMRQFLLERMDDGFCFPMNPLWACRDKGWWEVWEKSLRTSPPANIQAWYNKQLGVLDIVNRIHALCPEGFIQSADMAAPAKKEEPLRLQPTVSKPITPAASSGPRAATQKAGGSAPAEKKSGGLFSSVGRMFFSKNK